MHRGTNHNRLGDFNQRVVLDCVRRSPEGVSRVELATLTGLSAQTISTVARLLLDNGLVREAGRTSGARGKPRTLLELNPGGLFAVGVHLDPVHADLVLIDLGGELVEQATIWLGAEDDPTVVIDRICVQIEQWIARDPERAERFAGLGVGAPGPVDWRTGVILNPPVLPRWRNVPLGSALSARLDLPVLLEKDVIAAAAGESWLTPAQASFLFAYLGAGIGIGLATRGEVQRGSSHNFGDVGHLVVGQGGPRPECCGKEGTLGSRVSLHRLSQLTLEAGLAQADPGQPYPQAVVLAKLGCLAKAGDATALRIIDQLAADLAVGLAQLTDLLDVDDIVLGGLIWDACSSTLHQRLRAKLSGDVTVVPRTIWVHASSSPANVVPVGAASLIFDAQLGPLRSTLISRPVAHPAGPDPGWRCTVSPVGQVWSCSPAEPA